MLFKAAVCIIQEKIWELCFWILFAANHNYASYFASNNYYSILDTASYTFWLLVYASIFSAGGAPLNVLYAYVCFGLISL